MCFAYTLDHDRRITFRYWFLFLHVGVPYQLLLLEPCFSLSSASSFASVLCGLPSFGFLSFPHLIGPVATVSSFYFPSLFLLDASSVSLFLLCSSLQLWVVLRSLCGLQCSLWTYSLVGSDMGDPFLMSRVSAPRVSEFPVVSLMFSFRVPLLSFLPLGSSCDVGVPCVPSASLLSGTFGGFVCLLSAVPFLSSIPVFLLSRLSCLCLSLFSFSFFYCLVYLFGSFLPLLCLGVGASWCVSSYCFVVGWASRSLVLCCGCCLFAFLWVFTSCYHFMGWFSSSHGFAGVL